MSTDMPKVQGYDYALFGAVEIKPLSRVRKVIGRRLSASWVNVPHVAQFDSVDLSALESHRQRLKPELEAAGVKLSLLAYALQACARALLEFPDFNASLDESGENLVLKKYCHIAFATETPVGLLAPVVRDVDQRSLTQTAQAIDTLARKARAGELALSDAEGACFTVSNLGMLGGTGFTPVINAPEIGILGLARASRQLVEEQGQIYSRPMLPLTLVYDHRVIDGAVGARFLARIRELLLQPDMLTGR